MQIFKSNLLKSSQGSTLAESLLVVFALSSLAFLIANIPNSFALINKSKHTSIAREIAAKTIEDERALGFTNLADGTSDLADTRIALLPGGSGTVLVEDCPQPVCPNSEQVKQVSVAIGWKEGQNNQQLILKTLIGKGGLN